MKNKWKTAFFVLLTLSIISAVAFIYRIIDQGYSIEYMKDGYEKTEDDLKDLSTAIENKLIKNDFKEAIDKNKAIQIIDTVLELNTIKIVFDKETQKVKKISNLY